MIKERIQEVFEFTKSESPYRKANKGWINQDIFLDLSPSAGKYKYRNEAAKIILLWSPINILLSNIFLVIILGSILVFSSVSFAKDGFNLRLFNNSGINDIVNADNNKALNVDSFKNIDSINSTIEKNIERKTPDKLNEINLLNDDLKKSDEKIINKEIYIEDNSIKESENNEDIKTVQKKKTKSNFI